MPPDSTETLSTRYALPHFIRLCLLVAALVGSTGAMSQTYPSNPVKIIVSNSAGSAPDIVARYLADRFSRAFGGQFIVENRPGGDAVIGATYAARSPADGYTLYLGYIDPFVANRFRLKQLPYDPDKDFVLIANVIDSSPFAMVAHPSVPAKTFNEVIDYSRANPGKLSIGVSIGMGDTLAQLINKTAKADILIVPYRTNPQVLSDVVAGVVHMTLLSVASVEQFVKSGQLRMMAVSGAKRSLRFPDVPRMSETYPGVIVDSWFVLAGPTGVPADIVARLNSEVDKIVKDPEFVSRMEQLGFATSDAMTPDSLTKRTQADIEHWRKISQEIGIQPR